MKPACTLLLLTLLSSPFVVSAQENIEKTFTFGIVSNKAQSKIKKATPLTQYVTENMTEYGYAKGAVKVFKNYRQLAVALENGTVQIATATPFNAMTLEKQSNSQVLAIRWKKGLQKYHTVFFTNKESGIESFSDLRGKTLVFEKRTSTSSYYLPAITLLNHGEKLQYLPSPDDKPAKDSIGYLFLDEQLAQSNEINLSVWVYKQRVAAGAFSNFNWNNPKDLPENMKDKLAIFSRSVEIPRDLILASPSMSLEQQRKITSILLDMDTTHEGSLALKKFQNTKKFSALTPEMRASLSTVRKSVHLLPKVD
ncbi:phosphate/phosphite/phosphonate ABC transporter substrate-binding protein [Vibrio alginolyticus]|uniref:phosphate/phosphite/phosphonate ABC transporter substrate-binding protein n=1 Tax=Vibrio alginolyticus TaxID=663 RepID=UPI0015F3EDC8|nr:phosphate/phosphite/phosphonate ABC transporter substrate-binding protein [Vibrio alginolyticus]MCR9314582.1 phosphate/phosphite/phosphonate ABC transporter substrate-binding protein [Vibrio alginolyticus]MCR9316454.1 phosphate/phosphite/phosphonate ABC transporter substrate-binding protein [Vibrio alginolyticus]MCR9404098.1 phosphate/phosphite/phosphonate ABC transporter substrate-binding protein [Vibrio alginolyticus]MCR9468955.1 phosphate/phosphite/phosphonate ABC transporter substrate-bi